VVKHQYTHPCWERILACHNVYCRAPAKELGSYLGTCTDCSAQRRSSCPATRLWETNK
jgi:hypothetical protein